MTNETTTTETETKPQTACENCGTESDAAGLTNGICDDCRMDCIDCGDAVIAIDTFERCADCAITCGLCGGVAGDDYSVQDCYWCYRCFSGYAIYVECCGEYYHSDSTVYCDRCDDSYCEYHHDDHGTCGDKDGIHDYGYKPAPIFHGTGPRYMGVELEIDGGGESGENARALLEFSDGENLYYIKSESSLDDGLEIVTHPASIDYHLKKFPWADVVKRARRLGYTSHAAGTCGLHIHVSRDSLGKSHAAQELTISKLILLLWRHWPKLWKFSRRRDHDTHWCPQQYGDAKPTRAGLDDAKRKGRYTALNVSLRNTVEFRLFRGTLKLETLKATLQLVDVLIDYAMSNGISRITRARWSEVMQGAAKYPELTAYLGSRDLS